MLFQDPSEVLQAGSGAILTQTDQWGRTIGAEDPTSPLHAPCLVITWSSPTLVPLTCPLATGSYQVDFWSAPSSSTPYKRNSIRAPKSPHNTNQSILHGKNQATFRSALLVQGHTNVDAADDAFKPKLFLKIDTPVIGNALDLLKVQFLCSISKQIMLKSP